MDTKEVRVNLDTVEELLIDESKRTVGEVMKRFELSTDLNFIKTQVKELLHERRRDVFQIIKSYAFGREEIYNKNDNSK